MRQVELDKPIVTENNNEKWKFQINSENSIKYICWDKSPDGEGTGLEIYFFKR